MIELVEGEEKEFRDEISHLGLAASLRNSVDERLANAAEPDYLSPYDLAIDLVVLGENEQALRWLERALLERETDVPAIAVDPRLDPLRSLPGFRALLQKVALPSIMAPAAAPPMRN